MATKKQRSTAKTWKGKASGVDLELPSGNICYAKRPGMDTFLAEGKVPNALMPIITKSMEKAKGGKPLNSNELDMSEFLNDQEKLNAVIEFQNLVVLTAVKEPAVLPVPENESDREDDLLYIDEVDQMDKAFIFQWAMGGPAELEGFRNRLASAVSDLEQGEEVVGETVGVSGN
jgi:hypothetical protein